MRTWSKSMACDIMFIYSVLLLIEFVLANSTSGKWILSFLPYITVHSFTLWVTGLFFCLTYLINCVRIQWWNDRWFTLLNQFHLCTWLSGKEARGIPLILSDGRNNEAWAAASLCKWGDYISCIKLDVVTKQAWYDGIMHKEILFVNL